MYVNNFEDKILDNDKFFQVISKNTLEGFLLVDKNFKVIKISPVGLNILGLKQLPDLLYFNKLIPKDCLRLEADKTLTTSLINSKKSFLVSVIEFSDKEFILKLTPVDLNNAIIDQLTEKIDFLKAQNRLKSAFLANLSHDLKSPLHSLKGFSQTLLEGISGELTDQQRKFIMIISRNADLLSRMINNIIDLSKIDAKKVTCKFENFRLHNMFNSIYSIFKPIAINKNIEFELILNNLENQEIQSDENRLSQIILSLLDNSIRFSSEGKIILTLEHLSKEDLKKINNSLSNETKQYLENYVKISISDQGQVIPESMIPNFFDEYTDFEDHKSRKYGVAGLNYIASKKLLETLHGDIWLDSSNKEQTIFSFIVPVSDQK